MSITHVPDEELLVFDHEIAAPIEDVFGAYMDPELLVRDVYKRQAIYSK